MWIQMDLARRKIFKKLTTASSSISTMAELTLQSKPKTRIKEGIKNSKEDNP